MNLQKELGDKIQRIEKVFDLNSVLAEKIDKNYIKRYYTTNKIPYSIFHNNLGLLHMGITRKGNFTQDDLYEQAKIIDRQIKKIKAKKILELASGRGGNSAYLAKINPLSTFEGIDITPVHINLSKKRFSHLKNCSYSLGDFHNLKKYSKNSFDIIFIIEALCHTQNRKKVLCEAYRILKPKGLMIIFDGYLDSSKITSKNIRLSYKLIARGTALEKFSSYEEIINASKKSGFKIKENKDLSPRILPTLQKFERLSSIYYQFPNLAKLINNFFPKKFVYNTLYGYLTPTLIKMRLATYRLTILQKS
ncbi:hypothetical protein COU60_04600 [Candidatus Pacearchaeota archaeon CG10_big_fil_rev_8_21_14_0_10_34_76]|nr:MAG: hypothetical protein COU60_04600 [Candidatus Pacearchaeota archaeon CG10_big_fil_rev_8_21_14_0_10_34_76]